MPLSLHSWWHAANSVMRIGLELQWIKSVHANSARRDSCSGKPALTTWKNAASRATSSGGSWAKAALSASRAAFFCSATFNAKPTSVSSSSVRAACWPRTRAARNCSTSHSSATKAAPICSRAPSLSRSEAMAAFTSSNSSSGKPAPFSTAKAPMREWLVGRPSRELQRGARRRWRRLLARRVQQPARPARAPADSLAREVLLYCPPW
mmetsp:Transcript_25131/g.66686  ORF Transcript_25131/g.66686 Transcript_25131/m.66686 type:complete len:208 (-) Transcript_25131:32-655(-)